MPAPQRVRGADDRGDLRPGGPYAASIWKLEMQFFLLNVAVFVFVPSTSSKITDLPMMPVVTGDRLPSA